MIDPNGPGPGAPATRDKPWLMRTYAGHSSARESNALFRRNLAKGQTGLSVAFDLPTQALGHDHPGAVRDLRAQGVAAVFTPADFGITAIVGRIVDVIRRAHGLEPVLTMEG